jgi:hypothetical protein
MTPQWARRAQTLGVVVAASLPQKGFADSSSARDVECTIALNVPPEARASSLDNCLAAVDPSEVTFASVVVEARVVKRLAPAIRQAEKWKAELRRVLDERLPGIPIQESVETRGGLRDVARLRLVRKQRDTRVAALQPIPPGTGSASEVAFSPEPSAWDFGISLEGGLLKYRSEANYRAGGGSLWAGRRIGNRFRADAQMSLASLQSDDHKDLYNPSAATGFSVSLGPVALGLLGRVGAIVTAEGQWDLRGGAEPRVTLSFGRARVGAGYQLGGQLTGPLLTLGGEF